MNKLTERILGELLQKKEYWNKLEPDLKKVQRDYLSLREKYFLDEVWFPRTFRASRLLKAFGILPEDHFAWIKVDENLSGWIIQCDDIDCNCDYKVSYIEQRMSGYFDYLWHSDDWGHETFTLTDLLGIQSTPPGDYQPPLM